jgi:hypothetical protein
VSGERKYVSMGDWLAARAAGIDPGLRPIHEQFARPTSGMPEPPVPVHFPVSFPLFDQGGRASDRRRQANELLAEAGVRPRRR